MGVLGGTWGCRGVSGSSTGFKGARALEGVCARACKKRERLRVCSFVCLCSFVFVCACARLCSLCACARVRACMLACVSACARVRAFASDCVFAHARVCSERVYAQRRCARPPIARRRRAVFIARPAPRVADARAWLRSCDRPGSRAFGRRCHLDEPHDQRAVGCATRAHIRDRRRRRHLRHRRLRPRLQHLLPGRVGEHRRRCAAGLSPGWAVGDSRGYEGTKG